MNTKEAIEILEKRRFPKEWLLNTPEDSIFVKRTNKSEKDTNDIIELLKRGEKFEEMWEDVLNVSRHNPYNWVTKEYYIEEVNKIEQKYFPKGGS